MVGRCFISCADDRIILNRYRNWCFRVRREDIQQMVTTTIDNSMMRKIFQLFILLALISFGCKQPAEKYIIQAREKYHNQDYKGAIASYTRALEINPQLSEAYYNRGMVKKAFRQNCIGIFIKPGKLNVIEPGSTAPFSYLEELFPFAGGEIDDFTMAIKLNPGYADAYLSRAMAKFDIGQTDSACIDLRNAQSLGNVDAAEQIQLHCTKGQ